MATNKQKMIMKIIISTIQDRIHVKQKQNSCCKIVTKIYLRMQLSIQWQWSNKKYIKWHKEQIKSLKICPWRFPLVFFSFFLFLLLFCFTLQYCIGFAIHQHASSTGVHVFPILNPLSHLPPHSIHLGHPSAPAPSFLYPAIEPGLTIHFLYDIIHVLMTFSQMIPHPF